MVELPTSHRPGGAAGHRSVLRGRWWLWPVVGSGVAAAGLTIDPAKAGLSGRSPLLEAVALRGLTGLGLLTAGVMTGMSLRGPGRPWLRGVSTAALLAAGAVQCAVQVARGWAGQRMSSQPADLVVLGFNTLGPATDASAIAALVQAEGAQLVALPETAADTAHRAVERLAAAGLTYEMFSDTGEYDNPTSVLIRSDLGPYRFSAVPDAGFGTIRASPMAGSGPEFVAVHTLPPRRAFGPRQAGWLRTVRKAVALAASGDNVVVAGDFNATRDHEPLRDLGPCADAAEVTGRGAEGTWPARLPTVLAARIDHVLYTRARWRAVATRTVRVAGSDHRALIAHLVKLTG